MNYPRCPGSVFGMEVDAEAIVFVLDRSGSMRDRGGFFVAKREIARVVENLSEFDEFAVVVFDSGFVQFPGRGAIARATPEVKEAASAWLDELPGGPGTCPAQGLILGIETASSAASPRRAIVHVSDGGGTCHGADEAEYLESVLDLVADRNTEGVIIHAIGMLDVGVLQREFLTRLARDNRGVYVELTRWPAP